MEQWEECTHPRDSREAFGLPEVAVTVPLPRLNWPRPSTSSEKKVARNQENGRTSTLGLLVGRLSICRQTLARGKHSGQQIEIPPRLAPNFLDGRAGQTRTASKNTTSLLTVSDESRSLSGLCVTHLPAFWHSRDSVT